MKLTLSKTIPSPLGKHLQVMYAVESKGIFLLGDRWKIVGLHANGFTDLLWQTADEEIAHQWRGSFDERIPDDLSNEISEGGFRLLTKAEHEQVSQSDLYKSSHSDQPTHYRGHDDTLLAFAGKNITLLNCNAGAVSELAKTRTKGKDPISKTLHPHRNLIVYGTNHGELYGQPFEQDRFGKPIRIDQLPNTCYQITFSIDGQKMFVAGLGYVKIYECHGDTFVVNASITTAVRSFAIVDDYLILNKGMHGIDVIRVRDKPERVTSMDFHFMIDRMLHLVSQRTILLLSGSTDEWALLRWEA
nr:hypothetical protein [uncultured Dyadobacter sp.]